MKEAQSSTRDLCTLVEELLRSNQDLASRIRGLEREGSIIAESRRDDVSTLRQTRASKSVSFIDTQASAIKFTFDQDLQASRPDSSRAPKSSPSQQETEDKANEISPPTKEALTPSRLLGRFARRRSKPVVSAPKNPYHVTHTIFNGSTGQFSGLPKDWQRIIDEAAAGVNEPRLRKPPLDSGMVEVIKTQRRAPLDPNN
ncbi:mitogen-activated protein kinase [Fusarium bulbicola]|nr:mitogen-activated protein kinase [Fusarium bulbicola]